MAAWRAPAALAAGVLVVSTASILVRFAQGQGVPSLAIAAWRLAIAAALLLPLLAWRARADLARLSRADWRLAAVSGLCLALHFAAWIVSLEYTTVASSVALVTTNPIWLALFSVLVLRERLPRARLAAVALAMAGSAVVIWADSGAGAAAARAPLLGDALALTGSLAMCGYLLIGARLRVHMTVIAYIGVVYAVAALCLLALAFATGVRMTGYPGFAWILLVAMALGPQLLGHGAFNYALRHVTPTMIALAVLGEPVGSALLAWLLFGEGIGALKLAGMALLLAGIFLAARAEPK
ncbi:MAG: DMT family transporter [Burkholderiales bacterium]|nr:DMT family transporter [Burkholderiales bacterium]